MVYNTVRGSMLEQELHLTIIRVCRILTIVEDRHRCPPGHKCIPNVRRATYEYAISLTFFFSEAMASDPDAFLEALDSTLFPGISSSIEVNSIFASKQAKCGLFCHYCRAVLTLSTMTELQRKSCPPSSLLSQAIARLTSQLSDTRWVCLNLNNGCLLIEGIGGAIALLDGVYLPLHVSGVSFLTLTYGMPRVSKHCSLVRRVTKLNVPGWKSSLCRLCRHSSPINALQQQVRKRNIEGLVLDC
jgi:hypothetical protein